jgi:hypothetical protein
MRSEQVQNQRSEMVQDWSSDIEALSWLIDFKKYKLPHCHIYFVGPEEKSVTKIGISINAYKRLGGIQTGCWEPVKIHGSFWLETVHQARQMEKHLHNKLCAAGLHSAGEWFSISPKEAMEEAYIATIETGLKLNRHFPTEDIRQEVWDLARSLFYATDSHEKCTPEQVRAQILHDKEEKYKRRLARLANYGISESTMSAVRVFDGK